MAKNIKVLVYPTRDLDASKKLFNAFLDAEPYADGEYYVGYRVGDLEIGLAPQGQGIIAYTEVEDIKGGLQTLVDAGATPLQDPRDVGGGMLVAEVKDTNGNIIGLRQLPK